MAQSDPQKPSLILSLIRKAVAPAGNPPHRFDRIRKALVLATAIFMVGSIVYITSRGTQSAFRLYERGDSAVFIDKYLDEALRREILANIQEGPWSFAAELGIDPEAGVHLVAYFFTDRHYGVLSAGDRLVQRRLRDRPSSDFSLFRTISINLYANELVADSVASRDGSYVFVTANGRWKESLLHAGIHAMAARNMPASLAVLLKVDASFDAATWRDYRFVDETVALLVSDLYALTAETGNLDAAIAAFPKYGARRYALDAGPLLDKEIEIWYATFNPPSKTVEFYSEANAFGAFLLETLGRGGAFDLVKRFVMGNYVSFDALFSDLGGLAGALAAAQARSPRGP